MTRKKTYEDYLNLSYRYLSYKPRTIKETRKFLKNKGCSKHHRDQIIQILLDKQFLDDAQFAKSFIDNRVKNKPKSKFAIVYELKQKGISPVISESLLCDIDDFELAESAVRPRLKSWITLDRETLQKKVMNYLRYRGFSYSICISVLEQIYSPR